MLAHVGRCCTIGPTISAAPHERIASIFRRSWVLLVCSLGSFLRPRAMKQISPDLASRAGTFLQLGAGAFLRSHSSHAPPPKA